ncbi:ASCH domain-containing protein [Veronia pacifica]|uniref:ASCH domain-containing protein n=1 Tax=Veronia pacifica TaxID=1080227 RepID=A0A1C3ESL4_9GAMM|nr:ASCH domain-containing protein [Veronia pacifica]ODA36208.1 hypothetical protein A8L45_00980 [Veronia pacifica]
MKALSVIKPWASMIAAGTKTLEIRSWKPDSLPMLNIALVENTVRLTEKGQHDLDGQIVAIIDVTACKPWIKADCRNAGCEDSQFEEGWLAWEISNVRPLKRPVNAVARRKFYDLSRSEKEALEQQKSVFEKSEYQRANSQF